MLGLHQGLAFLFSDGPSSTSRPGPLISNSEYLRQKTKPKRDQNAASTNTTSDGGDARPRAVVGVARIDDGGGSAETGGGGDGQAVERRPPHRGHKAGRRPPPRSPFCRRAASPVHQTLASDPKRRGLHATAPPRPPYHW